MASLIKPWITSYSTAEGRKCSKDTPGAKMLRTRARKWYGRYNDEHGRTRRVPLCTDKAAAQQMLNDLVRRMERGEVDLINPLREHQRRPLADHLEDYRKHLESKDDTDRHVRETIGLIRTVLAGCGFRGIADLDAERVRNYLKLRRKQGMSVERSNHYVRAIKGFTRWMELRRVATDPLRELRTQDAGRDRRLIRRALPPPQFERLVEAARDSDRVVCGLTGPERAMLYVVAAYTGWRASELASLTPNSFDLREGAVRVGAADTKNGRDAELPLHRGLIEQLRQWMRDRLGDAPLWPGKWAANRHGAEMLRADLEAAGIPYVDGRGETFDFHALRGQFVTAMDRAGVPLVKAQRLARHSTPSLTANAYTRLRLNDLKPEVDKLPPPPRVLPPADGFAPGLAQTPDAPGPSGSSAVSDEDGPGSRKGGRPDPPQSPGRKGRCPRLS